MGLLRMHVRGHHSEAHAMQESSFVMFSTLGQIATQPVISLLLQGLPLPAICRYAPLKCRAERNAFTPTMVSW